MNRYKKFMEKKEIKEFWGNNLDNAFLCSPKGDLYHYTSANALSSILQNKKFWATKSNFMNDVSEIEYAWKLFLERLKYSNKKNI